MSLLLGIDIGTSSTKAVLFDAETGQIRASHACEYPIHKPKPGYAEQDPADWWYAVIEAVSRVAGVQGEVEAIGFSGQMHGTVLLDCCGEPVHSAIVWADQRGGGVVEDLVGFVGWVNDYTKLTGTLPAAGFMGTTLVWLRAHAPNILEKTRHVVFPKDYVRCRLTDEIATEVSDAAGSGIFDVARADWAHGLIQNAGLPADIFPPVMRSAQVAGTLSTEAATALHLKPGIPVIAGCADQPAQALGNGLISPGIASVTTGSGGQVFIPAAAFAGTDPRLHVFNHAVPEMWYVLAATLSAGLSLRWMRDLTGLTGPDAYPTLSAEAGEVPPGADGLIFLPYLAGERTPHMDPLARGAFVGLSAHHTRGHLARAVMEGVAFALRDALTLGLELTGPVETLIAAGGGAESDVWRQIQADVFGMPLQQTLLAEQASVGAAMLAGIGAGVYADAQEARAHVVRYGPVTEPDPAQHRRYNALYEQFRELYPRLKRDFHRLAQFAT